MLPARDTMIVYFLFIHVIKPVIELDTAPFRGDGQDTAPMKKILMTPR